MKCFRKEPIRQTHQYAGPEDFERIFTENVTNLYQLSFLLTGSHEKGEKCFVAGLGEAVKANNVFRDWAHSWSKRAIIKNAIHALQPRPPENPNSLGRAWLTTDPDGRFSLSSVLTLGDFERFVFVLTFLEKYSEHECAVVLGCSIREIRNACTSALEQLAQSVYLATSSATSRTEEWLAFEP